MEATFVVANNFGLSEYFKETDDVRIQVRDLFLRTKDVIDREREINLEIVLLIAALERSNAAANLTMWGGKKELAQKLGLTFDQYLKRTQAGPFCYSKVYSKNS